MESNQKFLNKQQTELRQVMMSFDQHEEAIQLFLRQHAMLHSVNMAHSELWSFEDEVLNDMNEERIKRIPQNCEHSVAWCIWHTARIEDVTMNLLVAGSSQIMDLGNWLERMRITVRDTGNEMDEEDISTLGATIDIDALRAYRMAVGRRTQEIIQQLEPQELKQQVDPIRVQQVMDEGVVVEEARAIANYWSRRDIAGLLLMPATRHNLVHLNEALRLKHKRQ